MSATGSISTSSKLKEAYKALDAIEAIVSDDFCEDLEMRAAAKKNKLSENDKVITTKLSFIYMISHSESPTHGCHHVHDKWRKLKSTILRQKKNELRKSSRNRRK